MIIPIPVRLFHWRGGGVSKPAWLDPDVARRLPGQGILDRFSVLLERTMPLCVAYCSLKKNEKRPFLVDARNTHGRRSPPVGAVSQRLDLFKTGSVCSMATTPAALALGPRASQAQAAGLSLTIFSHNRTRCSSRADARRTRCRRIPAWQRGPSAGWDGASRGDGSGIPVVGRRQPWSPPGI